MPARIHTNVRDGMKWCTGPCGRHLPVAAFKLSKGYPQGNCPDCHRIVAREWYRKKYKNDPEFRRNKLGRQMVYDRARRERRAA